jgi:hypothetical protein
MPSIDVPGSGNVTVILNQSLTINFKQECKFCVDSNSGATFNPALPTGQVYSNGGVWTGTATAVGTVTFDHVAKDGTCGGARIKDTGGRTITVSGTMAK